MWARLPGARVFDRLVMVLGLMAGMAVAVAAQGAASLPSDLAPVANGLHEVKIVLIRLPLAALLGAGLAMRPKRPGTPERTILVVETQIILAIVGALIMLVVGASLARAFGIVGAANLIRYRAKIDNPKDAVVMLATLAVGLASGVGLYLLAVLGTLLLGIALWVIEGFEPEERKSFELKMSLKKGDLSALRPKLEDILRRSRARFELRATADDSLTYVVTAPANVHLDRISDALEMAAGDAGLAVEWDEKKPKKAS